MSPLTVLVAIAILANGLAAQDVVARLVAGDSARCRRDTGGALGHLLGAIAENSMLYEATWKAARALVDAGMELPDRQRGRRDSLYTQAARLAEHAVRLQPGGAEGHYMVAVAFGRIALNKNPIEAIRFAAVVREEALRTLELDPRHDGAMHVLGRWNSEVSRINGAAVFVAGTILRASYMREASWDRAFDYFNRAIAIDPANLSHRIDLAQALIYAGRDHEARAQLAVAAGLPVTCNPQDSRFHEQALRMLR